MPLLKYTTRVPAERTFGERMALLPSKGASQIVIPYRFTGPVVLSRLIDALALHRESLWPGYGKE